jgi:ribosomal protein L7Ae-like RNA K-turn-binding protein
MRIPYTILPSSALLGKSFNSKVPMVLLEFAEFYLYCLIDTGAVISMMPGDFGESLA